MREQICVLLSFAIALSGSAHALFADSPSNRPMSGKSNPRLISKAIDIELRPKGWLSGFLIDQQGRPVSAAAVSLMRGRRVIARSQSRKDGRFQFRVDRGGQHRLVATDQVVSIRLWKTGRAPKSARSSLIVIAAPVVVRSQNPQFVPGLESMSALVGAGTLIGLGVWGIVEATADSDRAPRTVN